MSARKIYELHDSGALRGYRFGRAVRFDQADVDAYVSHCRTPLPPVVHTSLRSVRLRVHLPGDESELARSFHAGGLVPRLAPITTSRRRDRKQSGASGNGP